MSDYFHDITEVAKDIAETAPIYEILLQPAVRELGTILEIFAKTINIALALVSLLVREYD